MRINQYLLSGKHLFNDLQTYPDFITSDVKNTVEDICLYDYGQRKIRPYIERLTKEDWPGGITPTLETVVQFAVTSFINKNAYKYATLFTTEGFEYNPIENYAMLEVMTDDTTDITYGRTDTRTLNLTDERTANLTDETTPDLTETHTLNSLTNTETVEIEGFNSSTFNDSDRKTNVGTGSETTTSTGTTSTTTTGTDTNEHTGTDTNVQSGTDTHVRNYELTRTGNIGTVTAQDMVSQEREIADFSAVSEFTHDLINAITIGVY